MIVGIGNILVNPDHHRRAVWRTDRVGAVGLFIENPLLCHFVQVGRLDPGHAVTLEIEAHVLGHEPNNVWLPAKGRSGDEEGAKEGFDLFHDLLTEGKDFEIVDDSLFRNGNPEGALCWVGDSFGCE